MLPSLHLSALQVAVAQAVAAGARGVEAAPSWSTDAAEPDADGLAAVRDLAGPGVPVLALAPGGSTVAGTLT